MIPINPKTQIIAACETILDPEVGVDIWTMGLIYDIGCDEKSANITMTLTSPMCPAGPELTRAVEEKLKEIGFETVHVAITFDPPWTPPQALKDALGL